MFILGLTAVLSGWSILSTVLVNKGLKITNLPCNPWLLQMAGLRSQSSKDEEFDFLFRRPSAIRASQFEVRPYTKLEYDQ